MTDKTKPISSSFIFAPGAVHYSTNMQATQTFYLPLKNGGTDSIIQKRVGTIHVAGTSVKSSFAPAKSTYPTITELAQPTTWEVVAGIDVRNIGVVEYKAQLDPALTPGATVPATVPSTTGNGK